MLEQKLQAITEENRYSFIFLAEKVLTVLSGIMVNLSICYNFSIIASINESDALTRPVTAEITMAANAH
jgi:hypothetical protein